MSCFPVLFLKGIWRCLIKDVLCLTAVWKDDVACKKAKRKYIKNRSRLNSQYCCCSQQTGILILLASQARFIPGVTLLTVIQFHQGLAWSVEYARGTFLSNMKYPMNSERETDSASRARCESECSQASHYLELGFVSVHHTVCGGQFWSLCPGAILGVWIRSGALVHLCFYTKNRDCPALFEAQE